MTFSTLLCISFSLQLHYACQRINYALILFYTFFSYLLRYVFFTSYVYKRSCDKNDIKFRIMFCQSTLFVINFIKYTYFIIYTIFLFLLGFFWFVFLFFRAAPAAYRSSHARGPIYATATAKQDLSCICDPHCSSQQCWILNPLREARD